MPEREQKVAPKDAHQKPAEFTLKNEEGLKELGFSDYEIGGGRRLEEARKLLFEQPRSKGELQALRQWLEVKRADPAARKFQHLLEQAAALRRIVKPEIRGQAEAYLQRALSLRAESGPSGEFLFLLGQTLLGNEVVPKDPKERSKAQALVNSLRQVEVLPGGEEVLPLDAVTSPMITLTTRQEWWEKRILGAVNSARRKDKQKASQEKHEEKEEKKPPEGEKTEGEPQPPQRSKDHTPSMDDKKEAKEQGREKIADYTVAPGNTGFYEVNSWQKWDGSKWTSMAADSEYKRKPKKGGLKVMVKGVVGDGETPIPLRENEVVTKEAMDKLRKQGFKVTADSAGHMFVASGKGKADFEAVTAEGEAVKYGSWYKNLIAKPKMESAPEAVRQELERIMAAESRVLERAKLWQGFVQKWLTYASDSKWNGVYQQAPDYFGAVGNGRMADCDVANTFFLLGCANMGIDGELVGGYAVQKLDGAEAKLTPDDLHAVSRIYDPETKQLVVFDATPSDPSQKKEGGEVGENSGEDQVESEGGGTASGGERQPVDEEKSEPTALDELEEDIPDEKELKRMEREITAREKAEREAAARKVEAEEFAREAGCSEQEAQEVLDEIRQAMDMTGGGDSRIVDRLLDQFRQLIQELTIPRSTAMPSVPRSMGEELVSPVEAYVSVRAGAVDPMGFSRTWEIEEKIKHYGGFRLVIVNDRSGSMAGEKIKKERRVNFLVLEALTLFQKLARQQQSTMAPPPLNIETQILGFPGDNGKPITLIKPLSTELTNKDRLTVHRALSTSGGGNYDEYALNLIREQLTPDDQKRLKQKDLLMIVIINGDGGVVNPMAVQRELGLLTEMGVIVRGRGMGKYVQDIIEAYAPYGSCGDIDTYPEFVAEEIIEAVKKLAPRRVGRVS